MTGELDAAASDPKERRLMQGFPPAPEKIIRAADGTGWMFPGTRWSFSHQRELLPTARVWRGTGAKSELPRAERNDLDAVRFTAMDGQTLTWAQSLDANYTDGILILHKGKILQERYFGALDAHLPHLAMSVTKSFTGLLGAMLADEGKLDPEKPVVHYLPEMAGTAYGDATVRHVMDMTVGVRYSEVYTDPSAEIWAYTAAAGVTPRPPNYAGPDTIFDFLKTLKKEGEHGEAFAYKTCNTEVLAWMVQRVANKSFAELLSNRIWHCLGAEEDGYVGVDRIGSAMCGGGLNVTLRDLARFGEMMRMGGFFNGYLAVPTPVIKDIRRGADREHFAKAGYQTLPGWSYRNQWWVSHDRFGSYCARGIHGQALWIAPEAELVIARFASHPTAANGNGPLDRVSLPAYAAIADHLMKG